MAGFGGSVKLTGESEYRKALKQITLDLKEVDSELKVVASQYDKNDKSQEALTAQSEVLTKKLEAQAKKVGVLKDNYASMSSEAEANKKKHEALKQELDGAVKELEKIEKESGKTSAEYKLQAGYVAGLTSDYNASSKAIDAQEQALSKARTEINKAQTDYNNTSKSLKGLSDAEAVSASESNELGKEVKSAGDQAEKSANGGFTVLKGALANLASDALRGAIDGIKNGLQEIVNASIEAVSQVTDLADSIGKNSDKLGISTQAYQEWAYVFERSGADIEGFKGSFMTLTKAIENGSDAFTELGISAEDLENLDKEEIFNRVIAGLQGIDDQEHKSYLASQLLGKGATELGSLLQLSASDVTEMKNRVNDLGGVMSEDMVKAGEAMQDSLTDMKTSLQGVKTNLVMQFLPSVQTVVDGLTTIFSGGDMQEGFNQISEGIATTADTILNTILPNLIAMIPPLLENGLPVIISGIETVLTSLGEQLPSLINILFGALSQVLTDLCAWLSEEGNVSELLSGILALVVDLTNKFAELLPILLPAVFQVIAELADFLTKPENIEMLIQSTVFVIMKICEAIIASLPNLWHIIENLAVNLVAGIVSFSSQVVGFVGQLFGKIKEAVANWITSTASKLLESKNKLLNKAKEFGNTIKEKVKTLITNVLNFFKELPSKIVSVGRDTIEGLWSGLSDKLQWVKDKIAGMGQSIINSIKGVFGIASPSKVTKEVGRFLADGLGLGFESEMKSVNEDMQDALPTFSAGDMLTGSKTTSTTGGLDYYTMVNAFKEALTTVNVELDDQKVGKFVKKTVSDAIYT